MNSFDDVLDWARRMIEARRPPAPRSLEEKRLREIEAELDRAWEESLRRDLSRTRTNPLRGHRERDS